MKHAYLVMAHHRKDLLDLLFEELDDERNDIFLHIDKRTTEFSFSDFHLKHAGFYLVESMHVRWGGYSQIECELRLLEEAHRHGPYSYYHFLQGSSFPLKNQDKLHAYYDTHQGTEFLDISSTEFQYRIRQIFLFNELEDLTKTSNKILYHLSLMFVRLQQILGYDRLKKENMEFRKGTVHYSITEDFASYLLEKKEMIQKLFKHSFCGDEIMIQVMAYNSKFKENINFVDEFNASSLWRLTWDLENTKGVKRPGHNFTLEDVDYLMESGCNFARKFEGEDGIQAIQEIKHRIHQ